MPLLLAFLTAVAVGMLARKSSTLAFEICFSNNEYVNESVAFPAPAWALNKLVMK
ncbi:hypothetical protein [Mycoplasmopsis cynos]|uniref:hypothetical protein n=1 Tax=Mycoplasmopsis cynos TaxID=171284 RepID=UPI00220EBF21|nr:hypothetical protein [Mycoplasmopsis cynos]UWV93022.1 hypothetical protein NWE57_03380 [Mycoplasmopsis cynos]